MSSLSNGLSHCVNHTMEAALTEAECSHCESLSLTKEVSRTISILCSTPGSVLDLGHLNRSLMRRLFKMLTLKLILVQVWDWFIFVDLKDTYFHIQIAVPPSTDRS